MCAASSDIVTGGSGGVTASSSVVRGVAEGSVVSVATEGTPAASAGRGTGGGGGGGGGEGRNTGGRVSRPNGEVARSGWATGFLISSPRRGSGGAPSGKVRLVNIAWGAARVDRV